MILSLFSWNSLWVHDVAGGMWSSVVTNWFISKCFTEWISDVHFQGAKKVKAQGMGVHKPEEIIEFGQNDLKVLSDMLADKPFFFGDEPTTVST